MAFTKNDVGEGKPDWSLFPFDGAEGVVRILEHGEKKYSRDNWREGTNDPEAQRRIFNALLRHMFAIQRGETYDKDSGLPHIYHVGCNAMFLCSFRAFHEKAGQGESEARADEIIRDQETEQRDLEDNDCDIPGCKYCEEEKSDTVKAGRQGRTVREKLDNMRADRAAVEGQSGMDANHRKPVFPCIDNDCPICY